MAAEQVGIKLVNNGRETVAAVVSPTARQTFIPSAAPKAQKGFQAAIGANVPAVLAGNSRATNITLKGNL